MCFNSLNGAINIVTTASKVKTAVSFNSLNGAINIFQKLIILINR